ncbi:protein SRC2-like [Salvia miltiorrhiza]|uniref:protein SRC2-like n=1 Tax=Salvia miltiorrhiza TaxID=226208 RepID=UPI0025AB8B7E|nr:protein SRC2-like [Salvia miltiorrhiza]
MECRKFEITLISASDLENVRVLGKMKVHARVFLSGGGLADSEKRTPSDKHGETNPAWNHTMRFAVSEAMVENFNTMLVVKLYCKRKLGDRYIGEIHTPVKELFDFARAAAGSAVVCFPVQKGCVNSQGMLRFAYKFGEKIMIDKLLLAESAAGLSLG